MYGKELVFTYKKQKIRFFFFHNLSSFYLLYSIFLIVEFKKYLDCFEYDLLIYNDLIIC